MDFPSAPADSINASPSAAAFFFITTISQKR
jgi:hypothetical protein